MANENSQYTTAIPALIKKGNIESEFIYIDCPKQSRKGSKVDDEYTMIHPLPAVSQDGNDLLNIIPATGGAIVSFSETLDGGTEGDTGENSEDTGKIIDLLNSSEDYKNINRKIIRSLNDLKSKDNKPIMPTPITAGINNANFGEQKYFSKLLDFKRIIAKDVIYNNIAKYAYGDSSKLKNMISLRYINVINGRKSGTNKTIEFFSDFADYLEEDVDASTLKTSGVGSFKYISLNNLKDIVQYLLPATYLMQVDGENTSYKSIIRTKEGVSLIALFLVLSLSLGVKPKDIINPELKNSSFVKNILSFYDFDFTKEDSSYITEFLNSKLDFKETSQINGGSASDILKSYNYIKDVFTFILPIIKLKKELFNDSSTSFTIGFFTIAQDNLESATTKEDFFIYTPNMTFQNADGTYDNSIFNYGLQTGVLDGKIYVKDPKQYQTKFLSLKYNGLSQKKEFPVRYLPVPSTDLKVAYLSRITENKITSEDFITTAAIDNGGRIIFEMSGENFVGGATEPFGLDEVRDFKHYRINFIPTRFQREGFEIKNQNIPERISLLDGTLVHYQDGIELSTFPNILGGPFASALNEKKINVKNAFLKENYMAGEINLFTVYNLLNTSEKVALKNAIKDYVESFIIPHYSEDRIKKDFELPGIGESWSEDTLEKVLVTLFANNGFPLSTKILQFFGFNDLQDYLNYISRIDYLTISEDFDEKQTQQFNKLSNDYPSIKTDLNFVRSNLFEYSNDILYRSPNPYMISDLQSVPAGEEGTSFLLSIDGESFKEHINDTAIQIYNIYIEDSLGQMVKLKTQLRFNKGGFKLNYAIPDGTNRGGNNNRINLDDTLNLTVDVDGDLDGSGQVLVSSYISEESQSPISQILTNYNLDGEGRMNIVSETETFRVLLPFSDEVSGEVFVEIEYKGQKSRVKMNLGDPIDSFEINPISSNDVTFSSPIASDITLDKIPIPNQEFFQSKINLRSASKIFDANNSIYLYLAVPFEKNSPTFREDFLRAYHALSAFSFSERIFYLEDLIINDGSGFKQKGYLVTKDFEMKFGEKDFLRPEFLNKIKTKENNNSLAQLLFPPEKYQKYNFDELRFLKEAAFMITAGDIDSLVGRVSDDYKVGILNYNQDDEVNQIYRFVKHVKPEITKDLIGRYSVVQIGNEKKSEFAASFGYSDVSPPFVSTPDVIGLFTATGTSEVKIKSNILSDLSLLKYKIEKKKENPNIVFGDFSTGSISLRSENVTNSFIASVKSGTGIYTSYYFENHDTKDRYDLPNPTNIYKTDIANDTYTLQESVDPYMEDLIADFPLVSYDFSHSVFEWVDFKQSNKGLLEFVAEERFLKYDVICRSSRTRRLTYTSHYFDIEGSDLIFNGSAGFDYYQSNQIFNYPRGISISDYDSKKINRYYFYNKDFMLSPSTDIALSLKTNLSSKFDTAIVKTGESPNFAANQDLTLESFDFTVPSAEIFLKKLEDAKFIPSVQDINPLQFNPIDFSNNFDIFSNSTSISDSESKTEKSKYQGRFVLEAEVDSLSLVPGSSKFTPLEFNILNIDIIKEFTEDKELQNNLIAFKYDLPFSEYFIDPLSEAGVSIYDFQSDEKKIDAFLFSKKLFKSFIEIEKTSANLIRVDMGMLEFIKENGERVSLDNASNIVLEVNDQIDLYFSGQVDDKQKIFFSGIDVSGVWSVKEEDSVSYSVFSFTVTEQLVSAGLTFRANSEFSGNIFSDPDCTPITSGSIDANLDLRHDYIDEDKVAEIKEKDNDLFDPININLEDFKLKYALTFIENGIAETAHLMKSFCDFSFSMTQTLRFELQSFKNILVIVKVIFCIIDVICNLFNPVKAAKAIFRLFICLFDLLALLPQFSIPISFIHLGIHLLKLLECIVKKINDFVKAMQDIAVAIDTAIELKDLNSLLELERVFNKYIMSLNIDLNVLKPIKDILELFQELLGFTFIFPCSTAEGDEVFNVCGASDESVASIIIGKLIENNKINTKALFPIAQSYTTLSKNSLTLDSTGAETSYCGNTPPSLYDDSTTSTKQSDCFGSDLDIFKEAWNEYEKAGDSIIVTIDENFDSFSPSYVNQQSLRIESDTFQATYSASFTKTVAKFDFLSVDPRDCEFHFNYKGLTSELSFGILGFLFRKKVIDENQNADSPIIPLNIDGDNLLIDKDFVTNEEVYFVNPTENPLNSRRSIVKLEGNLQDGFTVPKLPIEYIITESSTAVLQDHKVPAIVMVDEDFHVYVIKKIYVNQNGVEEKIGITKIDAMRVGYPSFQKKIFSIEDEEAVLVPEIYYAQENYNRIKNFFKYEVDALFSPTPTVKMEDEFDPDEVDASTGEGTELAGEHRTAISSTPNLDPKYHKKEEVSAFGAADGTYAGQEIFDAVYLAMSTHTNPPDWTLDTSKTNIVKAQFQKLFTDSTSDFNDGTIPVDALNSFASFDYYGYNHGTSAPYPGSDPSSKFLSAYQSSIGEVKVFDFKQVYFLDTSFIAKELLDICAPPLFDLDDNIKADISDIVLESRDCINDFESKIEGLVQDMRDRLAAGQPFQELLDQRNFITPVIDMKECIEDALDKMCKFAFSPLNSSFLIVKDNTQEDRPGFSKADITNANEYILDERFSSEDLNNYNITGANEYASGIGDNGEFFTDERAEVQIIPRYINDEEYSSGQDLRPKIYISIISDTGGQAYIEEYKEDDKVFQTTKNGNTYQAFIRSPVDTEVQIRCTVCDKAISAFAPAALVEKQILEDGTEISLCNTQELNNQQLSNDIPFGQLREVDRILDLKFTKRDLVESDAENLQPFGVRSDSGVFGEQE